MFENVDGWTTDRRRSDWYTMSSTKRTMALGLGMLHWECGPYQICTNDESRLTLTCFMARSNLIHNAFIWEKS